MRIRKRSQLVAPATTWPLPISYKYQTSPTDGVMRSSRDKSAAASPATVCSSMQENRRGDEDGLPPASPQSSSEVCAEPPELENHRLSDAVVKTIESDADRSCPPEDAVTDEIRQKESPTKRRKIEHEMSPIFKGSSSMTAAELLVVNELANGVRQRLAASEQSTTTEQVPAKLPPLKFTENSKDALISSIFYVFDTCGESGLSASEVVKYMLEQRLPGLKEGGARHTVQVANVLRSSSSFISLGDKKYLLCSTLDVRTESKKPTGATRPVHRSASPGSGNDGKESPNNEDDSSQYGVKPGRGSNLQQSSKSTITEKSSHLSTRHGKNAQTEKSKDGMALPNPVQEERQTSDEEVAEPTVVKVTRRRGPSSSQKGKGPTQCKRYDGRGWQCSRLTEPGYSLCVHHQDLINKRAAKLKEQQTLSRLMESVSRKAKILPTAESAKTPESQENGNPKPPSSKNRDARDHNRDRERDIRETTPGAPVQKRKMLSLLAIK
ncbi:uncharacterized protein [Physcomitrium patens]|uniref:WRC domain-containing protein n=2 Tax=Physcomitrium patens TaxID=3218 RepID=A0A2K1IXK7_PHYPA|nr:uncharacterized protein LOC112295834 [Physcomitrium patens]PNR34013.1 hypothetical protein PHYPA_023829 [Physcomitrium patens]|eukprot:XP_024403586.1 uncharacterized protein LOC112295834 [Physcomitrella patens]